MLQKRQKRSLLIALALSCALWPGEAQEQGHVPGCDGNKIAILDLSDLAASGNYPKCKLNEVGWADESVHLLTLRFLTRVFLNHHLEDMYYPHKGPAPLALHQPSVELC